MRRPCVILLAALLSGCSAHLLEDVVEVGQLSAPRPCSEPTKMFGAFTMRATKASWKGDKNDATLTLDLSIANDKNFPLALSNSGNGVHYTVEFSLRGEKSGSSLAPKEASGIVLMREPKKFIEPRRSGPFGQARPPKQPTASYDGVRDLNYLIRPGEPELGKLTFNAPRANYLLTIERKFGNKPAGGHPANHIAVCRIAAGDMVESAPAASATPGLY